MSSASRKVVPITLVLVPWILLGGCAGYLEPHDAGPNKIVLCHKDKKTMELPEPAVEAHLNHGDRLGPCR